MPSPPSASLRDPEGVWKGRLGYEMVHRAKVIDADGHCSQLAEGERQRKGEGGRAQSKEKGKNGLKAMEEESNSA